MVCDLDLSPPSNIEFKNEYIFGSISSHVLSHIRYLINDTNEMHT